MVMGATAHCRQGTESENTTVGMRPVGDARFDFTSLMVNWFDHWLKDDGRGDLDMPKVRYYSLESGTWSDADAWPVASEAQRYYLSSGGHANSLSGDGLLMEHMPGAEPPDDLLDDPMHPVPTLGGGCCTELVSLDQTEIEQRADVLVYSTAPLDKPIDVAGYLSVTLYLSSSVADGDIMVKLVDVYPDGTAYNITDTAKRLRFRDGIFKEAMMSPGEIYTVTLGQMVIASRFAAGHRLRVEIAGTNFPQYERNLHTGGNNFDEANPRVAAIKLFHDNEHASFLQVPVVH